MATSSINATTATRMGDRLLNVPDVLPADNVKRSRGVLAAELLRKRIALAIILVADLVTAIVLVFAAYNFRFSELAKAFSKYNIGASLLDSICLSAARIIAVGTQTRIGWWIGFFATTLSTCKALVYGHASQPVSGSIEVFIAVAIGILELVACGRCMDVRVRVTAVDQLEAEAMASSDSSSADKLESQLEELLHPKWSSLRGTWYILRPYFLPTGYVSKLRTLLTFVVMAASKSCNLFAPLYIGQAAQTLAGGSVPYSDLGTYCALRFAASALKEVQSLVYIRVKQHAFAEIAEITFRHLLGLSLDWHLRKKMGEVLRVMDRGISSADSVMNYLILFLAPSVAEFGVTLTLFFVHFKSPALSATALLSFVVYVVLTVQITQWRKKFRAGQNKQDNKYHDIATDSLINFETVKYFANEGLEVRQFRGAVEKFQSYNIGVQASLSLLNSTQQLDIQLTTLVSLCLAATTILHLSKESGEPLQIGEFVSVNAYVLQLFTPLSFLGTIYSTVIQAFVDMHNLSELLLLSPDVNDTTHAPPLRLTDARRGAHVEFRNVDFSYPTQRSRGLRQLSFATPPGTTTAIVGPTGAGKSTISRLLFRFYDVDSGGVFVDGQNVAAVTQASLRHAIGVVPQDTVLFNKSIEANIRYGKPEAAVADLEAAASGAQILALIDGLEQKWETVVGERGLRLSGGEKQRVAIARCLLKDPPIVLLDEATSALDSATEVAVQSALEKLGTGRTQLVVAHRLSTIAGATQIIVMDAGRLVERGTHPELLDKAGLYASLWSAQQDAALRVAGVAATAPSTEDAA